LASRIRARLSETSKQTVGMATVNQPQLASLRLPFPPLREQERIVAKIETIVRLAEAARERLAKPARLLGFDLVPAAGGSIVQAVLAKAFSGELVPTEAELAHREGRKYEPACALMERIGAEKRKFEQRKRPI